ncbi:hypothetical protein [Ferrimonas balearica]|uniref:hypothetical protein n=1 Tax=Ferrimonas balearica TaxID=44012 RepID=UPI001C9A02A6|nr:hypothetical protein [Ferrimonas balearica]MBY5991453.1 hypothetical protein [Ferrimonas balearica]
MTRWLLLLSLLCPPALAQMLEPERIALLSLQGHWLGEWELPTPGSDRPLVVPLVISSTLSSDGNWLVERLTTPAAQFNQQIELDIPFRFAQQTSDRNFHRERLLVAMQYLSEHSWVLVFEYSTLQLERPVRIRQTWTRTHGGFERVEEIDHQDDKGENWVLRQRQRLAPAPP